MIYSISSIEIINGVIPDPKMFFRIVASAVDTATVNTNGIKTLLANGLKTFFIKGKLFNNRLKRLPKNPTDFTILDN